MHIGSSFFALTALGATLALSACITTIPPAEPPSQTIVAIAPGSVPGIPGVPAGSGSAKPALTTTASSVSLILGAERLMNDVLRDERGLAPVSGVLWLSSDGAIATINPLTGQIKALAPGTTVLTASLQSAPSVQTQVTVTVTAQGKSVQIVVTPGNPQLPIGGQVKLVAQVHLADGTVNANVDWSSSDNRIASVNPTTGVVTALAAGNVTIKAAYSPDGSQFSVSSVTVTGGPVSQSSTPTPSPTPTPSVPPSPSPTATPSPSPTPMPSAAASTSTTP